MKYIRISRRVFIMLGIRIREAALMVLMLSLYAVFEGLGIGLLLPVLQYLESGGTELPQGSIWPYLMSISGAAGIPLNLGTLLLLAFVPILLRQFVYYANTWYTAFVQNRATERLTVRTFHVIETARLSHIESQDQGALIGVVTGQVARCGQALVQYLRLLSAVGITCVYAALLALISWQLALIAVVAMGFVSSVVRRILIASRRHGAEVSRASVMLTSAVRERLAAVRLVKMRAREEAESKEIGSLAAVLRNANAKIAVASARVEVIVDPALMLAVFVIIFFGVTEFGLTLASLGLFMFILLRLNAKTKEVNVGRQALAALMPSFDLVEKGIAQAEAAPTCAGGDIRYGGLTDAVRFEDVWFSYDAGMSEVLKGVTLSIPAGGMTAIVGRSGAGKSTLVDMIPRLRVPSSGRIMFDDVSAGDLDLASLRKHIGFLTQEPILFNATIRENITYGLECVPSQEEVDAALEASYCTEFISGLPAGLETRLGDQGVRFSGGQRQRIALARVLLQKPDILILDEPTSALDSESERYIQQALESLHGKTTLVVIAHRLSTVQRAEQIVVLSAGQIAEVGTHQELIDAGGDYRRLFEQQIYG